MDSPSKRAKSTAIQWIIPAILLLVFLLVTLIKYSITMEDKAEQKAIDHISRKAISVAGYYYGVFSSDVASAEAIADSLISSEELLSEDHAKLLKVASEKFALEHAYIVSSDLVAIDEKGDRLNFESESEELKSVIDSKMDYTSIIDKKGNPVIVISAPIRTENEWWGNVVYMIKPRAMAQLIDSTTYSYSLVLASGMIAEMLSDGTEPYKVGDNMIDVLSKYEFEEGSVSTLSQMIQSNRYGTAQYYNTDTNMKSYLSVTPVGDRGASIVVSVDEKQIIKSARQENKDTRVLVFKITLSIVIFVALVLMIYVIGRIGFAKQSKELQNKAETDLLTDLLNKVSTEKKIVEYLEGEGKDKTSMMCVLDIDNFKKINDTMGHAFGDEVLSTLGKKIRAWFRVTDIVGRTGGDEFIIFLKDLKTDDIIIKESERIELFFKDFQVGTYQKYSPTASIGAAIYPRDAQDYEGLYKSADTALYKAKKRGKNQLAFYKDPESNTI